MKLINLLNQPMQHCEDATALLTRDLQIKPTKLHLQEELPEKLSYETRLAIADASVRSYDVSYTAIRQPIGNYKNSSY